MKKFIIVTICTIIILLACSCNRHAPNNPEFLIGRANLESILLGNGLVGARDMLIHHQEYSITTADWVLTEFTDNFNGFLKLNKIPDYKFGVFACGEYADFCRLWANKIWLENHKNPVVAGKYIYQPDQYLQSKTKHAICVFLVGSNINKIKPLFYDPIIKREVYLTDQEKASVIWTEF